MHGVCILGRTTPYASICFRVLLRILYQNPQTLLSHVQGGSNGGLLVAACANQVCLPDTAWLDAAMVYPMKSCLWQRFDKPTCYTSR